MTLGAEEALWSYSAIAEKNGSEINCIFLLRKCHNRS